MPIFDPFSESAAVLSNAMLNMSDLGGVGLPGGGVIYFLRDTFSTDTAAGSVNGTLADTGQARTVTDTNSKLSISGGVASVATGGVGAGDAGLWYPAITRVNGMILLGTFIQSAGSFEFGWDSAAAGSILFCIRSVLGSSLSVRDNGSAIVVGAALSTSTSYRATVGLRSAGGAWYWIKGGVHTKNKLIWTSPTGTANLLPAFVNVGTTDVYTVDDVRIPQGITFIPNPLASDWFTRANGALGSTETTGPDAQALTALAWQFTTGIWAVSSNTAVGTPATLGSDVIVNGAFAADTDWTKGAGWAIGSGTANATASSATLAQTVDPLTTGTWYQVQYTLSARSAGSVRAELGTASASLSNQSLDATYTQTGRADAASFAMRGVGGFTGSLDNISVKALTFKELISSVQVSTPDVIADVSVTLVQANISRQAGLILNLDSVSNPQNFILCYLNGNGNVNLDECVAGVYTNKFSTAITYSAGGGLRVIRDGTSARVFYNGSAVNTATMTANTNTLHGMFSTSSSNSLDFFTLWAVGNEGQYSALDAY